MLQGKFILSMEALRHEPPKVANNYWCVKNQIEINGNISCVLIVEYHQILNCIFKS